MNVYVKNKLFSRLLYNYVNILGYNCFDFNILNLNFYIDKRKLVSIYKEFKRFSFNIFTRRFNLFIDFLKMTILFFDNFINLSSYIKIWVLIFKNLHKRLHGKFFFFVKTVINFLLKFYSLSKNKKKNHKCFLAGLKFLVSGRIRGKPRSSSTLIQSGNVPTQSITKDIDFASSHIYTLYGVFGIKIWSYFKIK